MAKKRTKTDAQEDRNELEQTPMKAADLEAIAVQLEHFSAKYRAIIVAMDALKITMIRPTSVSTCIRALGYVSNAAAAAGKALDKELAKLRKGSDHETN